MIRFLIDSQVLSRTIEAVIVFWAIILAAWMVAKAIEKL